MLLYLFRKKYPKRNKTDTLVLDTMCGTHNGIQIIMFSFYNINNNYFLYKALPNINLEKT